MKYSGASLCSIVYLGLMLLLSGCSSLQDNQNDDPFEDFNRKTHEFNQSLDKNILRPAAVTYLGYVPASIQNFISNIAKNLLTPRYVVNNLLQGDLESGVKNTVQFAMNSTLGLGGIMHPAEALDIQGKKTDFGQTLNVWGAKEGPYLVLPFVGPSTGRDTFGILGDLTMDPIGRMLTADARVYTYGVKVTNVLGNRARFLGMIDSVLYESADSYEQTKLIYLQARKFELSGPQEEDYFDPYSDIFEEE